MSKPRVRWVPDSDCCHAADPTPRPPTIRDRRTKAFIIYKANGNLRGVQILLGHAKIESTVRYLDADVGHALNWLDEWRCDVAGRIGLYQSATNASAIPPSARVRPACAKAEADVPITDDIRHAQARRASRLIDQVLSSITVSTIVSERAASSCSALLWRAAETPYRTFDASLMLLQTGRSFIMVRRPASGAVIG